MADRYCTLEDFNIALPAIVRDVNNRIYAGLPEAVSKAAKKGRKEARSAAKDLPLHQGVTTKRYVNGFKQHMTSGGKAPSAEIGNEIAGLVHLLEKGHARVGGGSTRAFPHMIKAKAAADEELMEQCEEVVDDAL